MDRAKLAAFGERLKIGGEKLKAGSTENWKKISGKMKEIIQGPSQEAKMVEEATSDILEEPNWGLNLRICNLLNSEEFDGSEVVRAIKKKICSNNIVHQRLSLDLLEACAMNCDKVFSELASEKVLDDMVKIIENPQTVYANRRRAMQLIEAWGKSEDLGYLPVFRQTYLSMKDKKLASNILEGGSTVSAFSEPEYDEHEAGFPDGYPLLTNNDENADFGYHDGVFSLKEKKEFLVITRNSVDILSSMLSVETEQRPAKDDLMLSMVEKCKESESIIQRIIESTGDDESLLFEALSLHDELQQVLSKYQQLDLADSPAANDGVVNDSTTASLQKASLSNEREEEKMLGGEKYEVRGDQRNMEKE